MGHSNAKRFHGMACAIIIIPNFWVIEVGNFFLVAHLVLFSPMEDGGETRDAKEREKKEFKRE